MAVSTKRIVGWLNRDEFEMVYEEVFSSDMEMQQHALDKIAVWKCRIQHKLSTGIELTSQLISTLLFYKRVHSMKDNTDLQVSLHLALGMSIIRFVNLMTENKQNKLYAQPVHAVAEELGIPEWLVNLRHEATHSNMPSINLLYKGLLFAISWLKDEFWEPQMEIEEPVKTLEKIEADFFNLLKQCKAEREIILNKKGADQTNFNSLFGDFKKSFSSNQVRNLKNIADDFNIVDDDLGTQLQEKYNETDSLSLPTSSLEVWLPIVKYIHTLNLLPNFIVKLAESVTEENNHSNLYIMTWIYAFLKGNTFSESESKDKKLSISNFDKMISNLELNHKKLLNILLQKPNKWTKLLMLRLFELSDSNLSESQKTKLTEIVDIYTLNASANHDQNEKEVEKMETEEEEVIYNKQSILKEYPEVYSIDDDDDDEDDENDVIWLQKEEIDWSKYALGLCPGFDPDFNNFELPMLQTIQRLKRHHDMISKSRSRGFRKDNSHTKKYNLGERRMVSKEEILIM